MSLTGALNTAISSLRVNQASIQVLSANIAHVNDPNYTRKTLNRQSLDLGENQIGSIGIASYSSAISASLRRQVEGLTARNGSTDAQSEYMTRIQQLLGTNTDQAALPNLFQEFTAAWQMLQTSPESAAAKGAVIRLGDQLADEISRIAAGVDEVDREVKDDIGASVGKLNDLLEQVFEINLRLRQASETGSERTELIDTRDQLVREVAKYIDVRTVERDGDSISLFTPAGLSLIDGPPTKFAYDGTNVFRTEDMTVPVDSLFRDGRIRALLDFRLDNSGKAVPVSSDPATEVIRKLRSQLDGLVSALTSTTGSTFSSAYDAAGQSLRIEASFQTTIQAAVSAAQHSTVRFSGDLRPGDVFEIEVNGRVFSYTAQQNDTSLDTVAAQLASQINNDTTLGVTAVNGVSSLQLVGSSTNTPFTLVTRVNGELPELGSAFFTGTDRFSFQVNQALLDGTQQLKRNSASAVVEALTSTDRTFVSAGLTISGVSYKGMVVGIAGTSIANAKNVSDQAKFNTESLSQTEKRYQADVGVNLDEEIANLQVLQNAYAASARLLTVVQQLFDTLQAAVSR